jgi:uroporphyrinogen-III decarboxylase
MNRGVNDTMIEGITTPLPKEKMTNGARKLRAVYEMVPGAPIYQREFGYYCLDKWKREEGMPDDVPLKELFGFDEPGGFSLHGLGWCEAGFVPKFEDKILEDRGKYELVQDFAGRHVLVFKGRRSGFMPEYVDHPVKDMKTWTELCKWRMDPNTPERIQTAEAEAANAVEAAKKGLLIIQHVVGGYMYLRSLMGPEGVLYMFYDQPELIHECMQTWLNLADATITRYQKHVSIDEFFIGEDICYNHGPLISPDMIREFIFPYYQQLLDNIRSRQLDPNRHLFFQVDTDGNAPPVIPLYQELGMDIMSPFEVASGCDVVEIGRQYPELIMFGGVDKRVLAQGRDAIDRLVDRVFPVMKERGGFIPTSDHGVPEEVPYQDYLYYRKRCLEFA